MMRIHSLVISVAEGLPDVQAGTRRVSQINAEITDGLRSCLNKEAAVKLAELLNQDLVYTVQHAQTVRGRKSGAEPWARLADNTARMMDALCECGGIDGDRLRRDYAEYHDTLKEELAHRSGGRSRHS
ncbi:MAG: hypothetical protein FWH16_04350 [Oscillospiraceae bacterium]|nr:hypothetical protein [Oscillospiraceae bacterium]